MPEDSESKRAEKSDGDKDGKLWRGVETLHLKDGSSLSLSKVLVVTRYTLIVAVKDREELVLVPKHSVIRGDMRPRKLGEIAPV